MALSLSAAFGNRDGADFGRRSDGRTGSGQGAMPMPAAARTIYAYANAARTIYAYANVLWARLCLCRKLKSGPAAVSLGLYSRTNSGGPLLFCLHLKKVTSKQLMNTGTRK